MIPADAWAAYKMFESVGTYKDAVEKAAQCLSIKEALDVKEAVYSKALSCLENAVSVGDAEQAHTLFSSIAEYRDAKEKAEACLIKKRNILDETYNRACSILSSAKLMEDAYSAYKLFAGLGDFKDSEEKAAQSLAAKRAFEEKEEQYIKAQIALSEASTLEQIDEVIRVFESLDQYKNSRSLLGACASRKNQVQEELYVKAVKSLALCRTEQETDIACEAFLRLPLFKLARLLIVFFSN